MRLRVNGTSTPLSGELLIPNSKYHAHRALILASLARGQTRIIGLTHAQHVSYTLNVLRGLGTVMRTEGQSFVVEGCAGHYHPNRPVLSVGSSGTTLYFMIGLCALADRTVTLAGQRYFRRRPVGPLLQSLQDMGVRLSSQDGCPPIRIESGRPAGGHVRIPGTLSQWVSGLLLLAPFATGQTTIEVEGELNERPYVDLTLAMMEQFGLQVEAAEDRRRFVVPPNQEAVATTIRLPADIGSAAFGLAIAALHPSDVLMRGLAAPNGAANDHPESVFLDLLRDMGLPIQPDEAAHALRVQHEGVRLRGMRIDCRDTPDLLPILSTLGAFASGETILENVDHVRLKESDRVTAMGQLNRMGAQLRVEGSRVLIRGVERLQGSELSSYNDHRVLMSLAIAATRATGASLLTYPSAYRVSYPEFLQAMNGIGASMERVA